MSAGDGAMGELELPTLKKDADGLVAAVIQDDANGDVLMVGYMDDEALRRTASEGRVTFWSRSRQEYWRKGDTSGHIQVPRSIALDCDGDAILIRVEQTGPACHTGARSCFFTPIPMTQAQTGGSGERA
ncbi:phosphoribosyl-AMP cyclohydrolase [Agrococcus sp. KRD186]|uniref:phosphoribosyl-AMP cyclohydrolase n=1 Tax=Agrococcus sp. KRD186 TaxID=2729730 RepID=UPI0019D0FBB7|nr:phosphoribosyl-AMP cyclohydrolase [Agrococcus sp. KRD186]